MVASSETEKGPQPTEPATSNNEENLAIRAVAFPDDNEIHEDKRVGGLRPKGPEMKREMTQEDRELAAAGYEHIEEQKAKKGQAKSELDTVDIQEHHLSFEELRNAHHTSFDTKDPAQSPGLTSEDAKARLARDGQNILTPPKKKSALRKVRSVTLVLLVSNQEYMQYFDCLNTMFNILLIIAGILEYVLLGIQFKVSFAVKCSIFPDLDLLIRQTYKTLTSVEY
jgi:sodium/potassium-transporting ATPase subunit alpha